jgi:hypothetical protein
MRRLYLTDDTVHGLTGDWVWKYRLFEPIMESGKRAIVVDRNNGWATPDNVKTSEFPVARVRFYADVSRDENGDKRVDDAPERAFAMYRAADKLVHAKRDVVWGAVGSNPGLRVITARRGAEPILVTDSDRHGESAGEPLGEAVYVMVEYHLQVMH